MVDRMALYQERWGGLLLPPASQHDGGPKYFDPDSPEGSSSEGRWFEAGMQRTAVPYSFMIGPAGEFGIYADHWAPLHATVEGWVEALALAGSANSITGTGPLMAQSLASRDRPTHFITQRARPRQPPRRGRPRCRA
ncbi:hypothetical protein GCM10022206_19520 [Streptomyces chiangmaiensis]